MAKQFEASTISNMSVNNLTYHISNKPINHKYAKLNMILICKNTEAFRRLDYQGYAFQVAKRILKHLVWQKHILQWKRNIWY